MVKKYKLSDPYSGSLVSEKYELGSLVNETLFWKEIENSRSQNYNQQIQNLSESLNGKSKEELIQFKNTFDLLMSHSYNSNIWEKAYAINLGCSDDLFEYFRSWVIAQGKHKFYHTLNNPNYLIYFAKKEIFQNYEGIQYVAYDILERNGWPAERNGEIPKYELKGDSNIESGIFKNISMAIMTLFN